MSRDSIVGWAFAAALLVAITVIAWLDVSRITEFFVVGALVAALFLYVKFTRRQ